MADCINRIAGTAYLLVDGTQYALRGSLTVSPGSVEREGIAGMDGVHGYRETPHVPFISGDISDLNGLSLKALEAICNSTVQAELQNGKRYVLRQAWSATPPELNVADGQVAVRFEGKACEEMLT